MNRFMKSFIGMASVVALFLSLFGGVVTAAESKVAQLNKYENNGFQCLDISQTINKATMNDFTDFKNLEMSDKVHVCVKTDQSKEVIAGNKYVVVFDQEGVFKSENLVPSIFDK